VGLALSGNIAGLSAEELAALDETARAALRLRAAAELYEAGADAVIDSLAELPSCIAALDARLAAGERPGRR
jgi:phosphonoacetaldehyde hydrolase